MIDVFSGAPTYSYSERIDCGWYSLVAESLIFNQRASDSRDLLLGRCGTELAARKTLGGVLLL